jgi:RNA polymerase sigma-70 factor (ECF subfamily)
VTAHPTPLLALETPDDCESVGSSAIGRERTDERDEEFVSFVRQLETDLVRTTRRLAPSGVDPMDLAAEALARAYAQWDRIGTMEWWRAWVFRVVANLALTARSSGRRSALSLRRWAPAAPLGGRTDSAGTRLDDEIAARDLVRSALKKLPPRQREAITLHYLADLTVNDTALAMRVSPGTAKTHIERGITTLRGVLGPQAEGVFHD